MLKKAFMLIKSNIQKGGIKMTGLEALEIIKKAPTIYVGCFSDVYTRLPFECRRIEKELKALEIIADKCIDVLHLNRCRTYNSYRNKSGDCVPLEEYNFLRLMVWGYPPRKK